MPERGCGDRGCQPRRFGACRDASLRRGGGAARPAAGGAGGSKAPPRVSGRAVHHRPGRARGGELLQRPCAIMRSLAPLPRPGRFREARRRKGSRALPGRRRNEPGGLRQNRGPGTGHADYTIPRVVYLCALSKIWRVGRAKTTAKTIARRVQTDIANNKKQIKQRDDIQCRQRKKQNQQEEQIAHGIQDENRNRGRI